MSGQLKEVRERIKSVSSTQQITKAMKMVSASKLRRAQQAITEMRPYADKLDKMLKNIMSNLDGDVNSSFGETREVNSLAVVAITSNRGLCGGFNTNVIKAAIATIDGEHNQLMQDGKVKIYCIGKKGFDTLKRKYGEEVVSGEYVDLFSDLGFNNVARVSQHLMDSYSDKTYDKVIVCYGQFKNAAVQLPHAVQFLPVEEVKVEQNDEVIGKANYIFEPSKEELLEELIPSILQTTFQKFVFDNHASEHGARMTAMDKATENAEEMKKELKINYNKARQAAITKELSEIVAGAAAMG